MNQRALHAQRIGNLAGMLSASASKGHQRIPAHIVAASHRNLLDSVRDIFDCDTEKSAGQPFEGKIANLRNKLIEPMTDKFDIDWQITGWTKYFREKVGRQAPEQYIAISHRE